MALRGGTNPDRIAVLCDPLFIPITFHLPNALNLKLAEHTLQLLSRLPRSRLAV